MLDIGWTELLVIGIVALIVVGPKDLPGMFRALGKFTAKIKSMARDFQRAMDAAADEAGVKDVASDLKKATNPAKAGLDALKDAADIDGVWTPDSPQKAMGPETAKLAAERAESARKAREDAVKRANERAAEGAAAYTTPDPEPAEPASAQTVEVDAPADPPKDTSKT